MPGLFDADPSKIEAAQPVPFAAYEEVRLLSRCGANVLHEDAVAPVQQADIPIRLCSSFAPDKPGTHIHRRSADHPMIAVRAQETGSLCCAAGLPAEKLCCLLRKILQQDDLHIVPGGVCFSLPLPPDAALLLLRKALFPAA